MLVTPKPCWQLSSQSLYGIAKETIPVLKNSNPENKNFQWFKPFGLLSKATPIDSKKIVSANKDSSSNCP